MGRSTLSDVVLNKWDRRFLLLARHISTWSKDPRTQVGAVIIRPDNTVCSTGYNGFPRGMDDGPELYVDPEIKYARVVHAEMNAILTAPEPVRGFALYCTLLPCDSCAKLVIQSGIKEVIAPKPSMAHETRWDFKTTRQFFRESGVELIECDMDLS